MTDRFNEGKQSKAGRSFSPEAQTFLLAVTQQTPREGSQKRPGSTGSPPSFLSLSSPPSPFLTLVPIQLILSLHLSPSHTPSISLCSPHSANSRSLSLSPTTSIPLCSPHSTNFLPCKHALSLSLSLPLCLSKIAALTLMQLRGCRSDDTTGGIV